jgi:hypothetical protein
MNYRSPLIYLARSELARPWPDKGGNGDRQALFSTSDLPMAAGTGPVNGGILLLLLKMRWIRLRSTCTQHPYAPAPARKIHSSARGIAGDYCITRSGTTGCCPRAHQAGVSRCTCPAWRARPESDSGRPYGRISRAVVGRRVVLEARPGAHLGVCSRTGDGA